MPFPGCGLWTAADRIGQRHLPTCLTFYPPNHTVRVDVEKAVIAYATSSDDADVVSREVLGMLEDLGQSRCRIPVPVVKDRTFLQWMDGRDLEPAVECSRSDSDVVRQPTVHAIVVDRSVRDWWCSGAVWVEMCGWCGCRCCHGASSQLGVRAPAAQISPLRG